MNSFSQTACIQGGTDFTGFCSEFYPNGKVKWVKEFKDGQAIGIWMCFDEKGNLKKQLNTVLKRDSLDKSYKFEDGNEVPCPKDDLGDRIGCRDVSDVIWLNCGEANFPGGYDSLRVFVSRNMVYPPEAIEMGLQGKCYLKFIVEVDGSLTNISVIKGVPDCPQCDKEAIRVLKMMPPWKPEIFDSKKVRSWGQIPLNFILE